MGNIFSGAPTGESASVTSDKINSDPEIMEDIIETGDKNNGENLRDTDSDDDSRAKRKEDEMNEFRKQLSIKREQRREILSRHRNEKKELEKSLKNEIILKIELAEQNKFLRELLNKNNIDIPEDIDARNENINIGETVLQMKDELEKIKSNNNKLRVQLAMTNNALQNAYSDMTELSAQNTESFKQIKSLKEVITVSKTMINLREEQLNELKKKLKEIEQSLADRETHMLSADLRQEYERQLQNIRTLRGLYEERARLAEVTRQALSRDLQEQKELHQAEVKKCQDLSVKVEELESTVNTLEQQIEEKINEIASLKNETYGLKAEMDVVNKLFSQVLLGYKSKQDLDKLVNRLEENHGILTQMAEQENGSEASSALPKLLLQLVSQVEESDESKQTEISVNTDEETVNEDIQMESGTQSVENPKAEEIVQNLPKVWRVLIELLSHQSEPQSNDDVKVSSCYKSVETKSGPVLVPSVSQTYIRLKDLIIEKLGLIKEVNRMKQLNGHLETRLQEQERRLCLVTTELSKTWHVVGRLRKHHHQLHTHEKILKYELQQKRKLLNELKEELEYCREKWKQAREKNSQSENDWKKLRAEFSSRKTKSASTFINNSAESGYSDERPSDESSESNDESEYIKEPQVRCRKKIKKSIEVGVDSSADFNLAAEREDPASDMLDVADLPLDNQEPGPIEVSDTSIHLEECEKIYAETEDEVGDIAIDSCIEEISMAEHGNDNQSCDDDSENVVSIDKATSAELLVAKNDTLDKTTESSMLNNDTEQNERLETQEKISLPKRTELTSNNDEQLKSPVNHLSGPSTSSQHDSNSFEEKQANLLGQTNNENHQTNLLTDKAHELNLNEVSSSDLEKTETASNPSVCDIRDTSASSEPCIDFKAILENIKKQDERLVKKDQRLQNLESGCSDVIQSITNTLQTGDSLSDKLHTLHEESTKSGKTQPSGSATKSRESSTEPFENKPEAFTSEVDHEAMFAARDERLKRLEEQTKSLVKRVNKTATKGVKINYKLQELHNIYGSETSRAGTPSEDNEDDSQGSSHEKENEK
ncbi:PREDICTED: early endosome antigen 1 [Papilio xuthus]|uniref:Early endosome antigen 1 n=1 Tax=Papilio xuthus TaxID=66420 RepID=A0AAJ7EDK8_PAPXU|nr:PREDICTED: early endosome antigen 1 [Papilio xuthus]